jgi:cellobiose phosphorylase
MGNTWRAVALGMMGLRPATDALGIDPCLPPEWPSLDVRVRYRGRSCNCTRRRTA